MFVGNGPARGPWTADACHAGPVSGLLTRAAENTITDKQMVRLTANFVRPVPMDGFRIETEVIRDGRTVALVSTTLRDRTSRICATATSTHIVKKTIGALSTPFQSICPLSDCGNGISRNLELNELSFVNPDITIALHRLPESEWLASSAVSHWQSNGIGLAHATLFDEIGAVGVALQSLVLRPL